MTSPIKAGVYKMVDAESHQRMKLQYEEEISKSKTRGQQFCEHRNDYKALKSKLEILTDKTTHQVMVPFTKKAFMPGHLVHTNEILVLLGDNWFAERSAKQAREICDRRLAQCEETLAGLKKEIDLYESWVREAEHLVGSGKDGEGNLEIREPLDESELEKWRKEHREKVKAYRKQLKGGGAQGSDTEKSDEELWRRLDELELEEELEEHLARSKQVEETEVGDESSPEETESDSSEPDENSEGSVQQRIEAAGIDQEMNRHFETTSQAKSEVRKVSFGSNREHIIGSRHEPEAVLAKHIIQFSHTPTPSTANKPLPSEPNTPGDLFLIFGTRMKTSVKSILKPSSSFDQPVVSDDDFEISFDKEDEEDKVPVEPAVAEVVHERLPDVQRTFQPPAVKKQSLFKQARSKR